MPIIENLQVSDQTKRMIVQKLVKGEPVIVRKADGSLVRIVPSKP